MPSSEPTAQRRTRGYASLALAAAGLAALTGIAVWYLSESNLLDRFWSSSNRRPKNRKKKSVVVVVDEYISKRLPSFEVSRDYAELYLISGPGSSVGDDELYEKVEHPTQLLHCETPQGIIHITKHIKPDVLLTAPDDGQPISDLQGWVGKFILVNPKLTEGSRFQVVQTAWPDDVTLEDLLLRTEEDTASQ